VTDDASRARLDASQILQQAVGWRLSTARWALVSELITALDAAQSSGDIEALTAAATELELVGPVRIVRMGSAEQTPPPASLRERANSLVHRLLVSVNQENDTTPDSDG
jgi:hypothetical protein